MKQNWILLAGLALSPVLAMASDCNLEMTGLTSDQRLVTMRPCMSWFPRLVRGVAGMSGADTTLVGIDYRPQDGKLYGLGNGGGIYEIDPKTGLASKSRQLTIALDGTEFDIDFNPAADALRILSNTGQNLRHPFANPSATTVADGTLNYTAGTPAAGIAAGAYINNDLNADTGTFLFDLDTTLDQLALQVPPNNGTLVRIGALGVDASGAAGFDIYSRMKKGIVVENTGYAVLVTDGKSVLYEVNLLTGALSKLETLREDVVDLAIPMDN